MKIALSTFNGRVSPVFDWSTLLVVIDSSEGREVRRQEHSLEGTSPKARVDRLVALGIDTLICGGISRFMLAMLEARSIKVIPWIAGEVEQVITAFLEDRIPGEGFFMPGCCGRSPGQVGAGPRRGRSCRRRGKGPGPAPRHRKER
jgi:predicted Fe-Mo cluster-binding NifX family protein